MTLTLSPYPARRSAGERKHFDFLASLPCVVTGTYVRNHIAHIRYADSWFDKGVTGNSRKPECIWTLPLHYEEHTLQHTMNEREYWRKVGFNPDSMELSPLALCRALWAVTGDTHAGQVAISEHRMRIVMAA